MPPNAHFIFAINFAVCLGAGFAIKASRPHHHHHHHHTHTHTNHGNLSFTTLPRGSRIAIVLRGQTFRDGGRWGESCSTNTEAVEKQLLATKSVLDKVALAFDMASHTVDIYLFESSNCSMFEDIVDLVGPRLRFRQSFRGKSQSESMNRTVNEFKLHDPAKYRVIIMLRLDVIVKSYVYQWPNVDYDKFNFYSHCPLKTDSQNPFKCVNDVMHVMPGKYFAAWQRMVGRGRCFNGKPGPNGRDCGHLCYGQAVKAFGQDNVGFVTDWAPESGIRETSPDLEIARLRF